MMDETTISEISKVDDDARQVFGWAYVSKDRFGTQVIDKSGDFIDDPASLEECAYHFVREVRVGGHRHRRTKVSKEFGPEQVGTLIESVYVDVEKARAMGIPKGILPESAWWIGLQIHDDDVWQDVKDGKLTQFSIHGLGTREAV